MSMYLLYLLGNVPSRASLLAVRYVLATISHGGTDTNSPCTYYEELVPDGRNDPLQLCVSIAYTRCSAGVYLYV
jgi:hypothetical protein